MNEDEDGEDKIDRRYPPFTSEERGRILRMLEDHERRKWLFGFIGRVSKWIMSVGAALAIAQTIWTNLVRWAVRQ